MKFSIILICAGLLVCLAWLSGSHGHLQFRPNMAEDWIAGSILVVCFGIPVLSFIARSIKK